MTHTHRLPSAAELIAYASAVADTDDDAQTTPDDLAVTADTIASEYRHCLAGELVLLLALLDMSERVAGYTGATFALGAGQLNPETGEHEPRPIDAEGMPPGMRLVVEVGNHLASNEYQRAFDRARELVHAMPGDERPLQLHAAQEAAARILDHVLYATRTLGGDD